MIGLIDGDMLCYRAAYAGQTQTLANAKQILDSIITSIMDKTQCCREDCFGYLTGAGNFRNEIAVTLPYKGNRVTKEKPAHLAGLREYSVANWGFQITSGEEADDAIAIEHTRQHHQSLVISDDKDFLQLPGSHYFPGRDYFCTVTPEEALYNFYTQILTGDVADNILGINGIGPVKARRILGMGNSAWQHYQACVRAYQGDKARVIENARLLWLRRTPSEWWTPPTDPNSVAIEYEMHF